MWFPQAKCNSTPSLPLTSNPMCLSYEVGNTWSSGEINYNSIECAGMSERYEQMEKINNCLENQRALYRGEWHFVLGVKDKWDEGGKGWVQEKKKNNRVKVGILKDYCVWESALFKGLLWSFVLMAYEYELRAEEIYLVHQLSSRSWD